MREGPKARQGMWSRRKDKTEEVEEVVTEEGAYRFKEMIHNGGYQFR